ncbi:hypothetical protein, partial [Burkholderia anthina]|uniref:hypothetical protein n=1 Tax=Burkholderia anthina TaxID=179879 RepID=UPI001ABAFB9D
SNWPKRSGTSWRCGASTSNSDAGKDASKWLAGCVFMTSAGVLALDQLNTEIFRDEIELPCCDAVFAVHQAQFGAAHLPTAPGR